MLVKEAQTQRSNANKCMLLVDYGHKFYKNLIKMWPYETYLTSTRSIKHVPETRR